MRSAELRLLGSFENFGKLCEFEVLSCDSAIAAQMLFAQCVLKWLCIRRLTKLKLDTRRLKSR